jgi:hypothetical protein
LFNPASLSATPEAVLASFFFLLISDGIIAGLGWHFSNSFPAQGGALGMPVWTG